MNRTLAIVLVLLVSIAGAAAGFRLYHWTHQSDATATGDGVPTLRGQQRPDFKLADLDGKMRDVAEWNGKVVLLNFWATWCPPCRHEIPAFIQLQKTYGAKGLQIVGVALDQPNLVEEYRDTMSMNYPVLVGEMQAVAVSKQYGNSYGMIPYTVFIDRKGHIAHIQRGEISTAQATAIIKSLL